MRNHRKHAIPIIISICIFTFITSIAAAMKPPEPAKILLEGECNGRIRIFCINTDGTNFGPVFWDDSWDNSISPDGNYIGTSSDDRVSIVSEKGKRLMAASKGYAGTPVFSPDGHKVALDISEGNMNKFIIEDVDGGNRHTFLGYNGSGFVFSPDGKHIAFVTGDDRHYRIFVADYTGRNRRFLADGNYPAFSPDGKHIVFVPGDYGDYRVFIIDYNGRNRRLLAKGESPSFSPDGKTIAYAGKDKGGQDQIYLIDPDGRNDRLLTKNTYSAVSPIFSPDSKKIAFESIDEKSSPDSSLHIINLDGTNELKLSEVGSIRGTTFSPDGQYLAYATEKGGTYIVSANGGESRLLTNLGGGDIYWGPTPFRSQQRPGFPGLPENYYVDKSINADFDGDGRPEQACTAGPVLPPPGGYWRDGAMIPLLVLIAKDGKLISQFAYKEKSAIIRLQAIDLTGDDVPELVYDLETYGGDNSQFQLRVHHWDGHAFRSIIKSSDGTLFHWDLGGVAALIAPKGKPSRIVVYNFTYSGGECHADAHHSAVGWYDFVDGRFVKTKTKVTTHRYSVTNPLLEFGIKAPSRTVKVL